MVPVNSHRMRALLAAIVLFILAGCSSGNGVMSCSATSNQASTSPVSVQVNVFCSGGTAPYAVTALTIGGRTPTTTTGTSSGFASTTQLVVYDSTQTTLQGQSGSLTLADSGSGSVTFPFTVGTSSLQSSTGCTMTPSTTVPALNQSVTFSMAVTSGWGTAPYTFAGFLPGTSGTVIQSPASTSSTSATAQASYSVAGSAAPSVTVTDSLGNQRSCTTAVTVGGSGTSGGLTCTLTQSVLSSGQVAFQASSSTGEVLKITNFSPGSGGTTLSSGNPIYASYSFAGQKTASAQAYATATGVTCNGGSPFSVTFTLGSGSGTGSLSCQALLSSSYFYRGQSVTASASVSGGNGNITLKQILYPTQSGMTGYYTGPLTAVLNFPYAGTFGLQMIVQDSYGSQATCNTSATVY